jgi:putative transcriptional regulator
MYLINFILQYILDILQYITYLPDMSPVNMKLRVARTAKRLSQQELAEAVQATRQTVGLIENGKYNPTLNLCLRIARALDKTLDELFWPEVDHG